jgi:hypothetical protein
MRFILILICRLSGRGSRFSACTDEERPVLLTGALYHGFSLVAPNADGPVPNAWMVLADGQIVQQGAGAPPPGDFVVEVDLSGARVVIGERGELIDPDGRALTDWTAMRDVAFVGRDGVLHAAEPLRRPFEGGEQTASPETPLRHGD